MTEPFLDLTVQGSRLTSSPRLPVFTINGLEVTVDYGESRFPAVPGPMHLEVRCQGLRPFGQAGLDVEVPPSGSVRVFYAPPWHQFAPGRLGTVPQVRSGLAGYLVTIVLVVVMVIVLAH